MFFEGMVIGFLISRYVNNLICYLDWWSGWHWGRRYTEHPGWWKFRDRTVREWRKWK